MDRDRKDASEYVLRWLAADGDGTGAKATALDLRGRRFTTLLRALHGEGPARASSRHKGGETPEDPGEVENTVIRPPGPPR